MRFSCLLFTDKTLPNPNRQHPCNSINKIKITFVKVKPKLSVECFGEKAENMADIFNKYF